MATKGFKQPFHIRDKGPIQVGSGKGYRFRAMYDCANMATAHEICQAINLVWQALEYGEPDPALKKEFRREYGHLNYTDEDVIEFTTKMAEIGMLPASLSVGLH